MLFSILLAEFPEDQMFLDFFFFVKQIIHLLAPVADEVFLLTKCTKKYWAGKYYTIKDSPVKSPNSLIVFSFQYISIDR